MPEKIVVPGEVLIPGTLVTDGVEYEIVVYGDAEAEKQVIIRLPGAGAILGGELMFNGMHGFLGPG